MAQPLALAPLQEAFRRRGVRLQPMEEGAAVPLAFSDAHEEHLATRRAAGLFDFSFMAHLEIAGAGARGFLERLQTRSLADLAPGKIRYTLLLREDGTVFADATLWCLEPDRYWLFTGRRSDVAFVATAASEAGVRLREVAGECAVIALQGPDAPRILERWTRSAALAGLAYFALATTTISGVPVTIGRLGYSGELGYEIIVGAESAQLLWGELIGHPFGVRECGLEAADSLRVESGYILFSAELARPADPYELGLERLVAFDARRFTGSEVLRERRWRDPARRLVGLVPLAETGRPPSASAGLPRAEVTSRAFSPVFGRGLALGFVPCAAAWPGELVACGDSERARVARLPFYDPPRALPQGRALGTSR
jgi:glycine cleavage system aminomethyltransferase T